MSSDLEETFIQRGREEMRARLIAQVAEHKVPRSMDATVYRDRLIRIMRGLPAEPPPPEDGFKGVLVHWMDAGGNRLITSRGASPKRQIVVEGVITQAAADAIADGAFKTP